ncbi:hypothetical protein L1F30_12015 [Simiduia sp. 21SJ11W-1]|uniref:hypothetical protein n=1 Tax=Simiduia sp. 21SJ11W-1 TaxID=2909669 RepID=UPI00209CC976|nr:hypothetical protein [Simiduia sp. 21SJ11W-1]UTA46887.1 hypothetical protein L1F30_12015 [Simiduia sp. 21SJ11W-1]
MDLNSLIGKTCVIGLSYFDLDGRLLKQSQCCGQVIKTDAELGITLRLQHTQASEAEFILPPNLNAWYKAPAGHYRNAEFGVDMENPDYLVTWDIHRTQQEHREGQHEWWEWVPNTQAPQVGSQGS